MNGPRTIACALAAAVLAACSGGPSLADYAGETERLVHEMNESLDDAERKWIDEPQTVEAARDYYAARARARWTFVDAFTLLEPPESASDLHAAALDLIRRLAEVESAMAEKVAEAETPAELLQLADSPEFRAFGPLDAEAIAFCRAAQAQFDATGAGEGFEGMPWIPAEMQEVIEVVFRCTAEERGLVVP